MAKNGGSVVFDFKGDDSNLKKTVSSISKGISGALKVTTTAIASTSLALGGLVTAGVKSYADLEQNVGGIETLFKDASKTVIENSKKAYETAGMSANQYMETVTSFSARLLQGLGGDTKKAAEIAHQAVVDMSDNANKMGTSMEMIQNAYQGFAKQNYTMLDNLKLGYGGTQSEMARLINDSGVLGKTTKVTAKTVNDVSFDKIIEAIHVIQDRMEITGTTSKEAATTISGSINSMKASFNNFLNGTGSPEELSETIVTVFSNVSEATTKLAPQLVKGLVNLSTGLASQIPQFIQLGTEMLTGFISGMNDPKIMESIPNTLSSLITGLTTQLPTMIPQIIQLGINLAVALIQGMADSLPNSMPVIVDGILNGIETLTSPENIQKMTDASSQLILALIQGLINSIPQLVEHTDTLIKIIKNILSGGQGLIRQVGIQLVWSLIKGILGENSSLVQGTEELITKGLNKIREFKNKFLEVGSNLVQGLINGIVGMKDKAIAKINDIGSSLLKKVKSVFGVHSPSTEFEWVGKMNMLGLEQGMLNMKDELNTTFDDMINLSPSMLANASNTYNPNVNVIVNNSFEQDPLGQMVQARKTFSGGSKNDYNFGMGG